MLQKGVVNRDARLGVMSGPSHRLRRKSRAPRHDASMLAPAPRTSSIATGRIPPLLVPMQSIATPTPTHTISSSWPGRLVLVVIEAALLQPVKSSPPALAWTRRGVVQRRAGPRHGQPWPRRASHARSGAPAPAPACSASRRLSSIAPTA